MFNVSRTNENQHHKAYIFRILRKKKMLTRKFLKNPGIIAATPLMKKKFKMVAKAVEKM